MDALVTLLWFLNFPGPKPSEIHSEILASLLANLLSPWEFLFYLFNQVNDKEAFGFTF